MNKVTCNWVKGSDYDIATSVAMLKSKRYVYVIFFCHLALEKLLKAALCAKTAKTPPKTHDLLLLLRLNGIGLPERYSLLAAHLNTASIPTRYPEDITKISKYYNRSAACKYLAETKSVLRWIKQNQKLIK